ncbi:MAG: hypothetical protein SHS37scaffold220_38 [Phage 67_12]|nr:MAG: hypothetical protein SHS37scaffold220_38 [Phage 67_12]
MTTMRAKLQINSIARTPGLETLKFNAVCPPSFDKDGLHEDSTFSKYSPSAVLEISITNPALHGKFNPGDKFYVDFTPAPDQAATVGPV